jgi:hypothetical protein
MKFLFALFLFNCYYGFAQADGKLSLCILIDTNEYKIKDDIKSIDVLNTKIQDGFIFKLKDTSSTFFNNLKNIIFKQSYLTYNHKNITLKESTKLRDSVALLQKNIIFVNLNDVDYREIYFRKRVPIKIMTIVCADGVERPYYIFNF